MKIQTSPKPLIRSCFALALVLAVWTPLHASPPEHDSGMMMQGKMKECTAMMAEMKAQNAALSKQVAEMNSAPEDKKLDLLAAIVTRMVKQRTDMEARMEKMRSAMMKDMPMGKGSMPPDSKKKGMDMGGNSAPTPSEKK
ncbi:hypothetical protein BH09VER1_BH09VER1_54590 [soil metagenome]